MPDEVATGETVTGGTATGGATDAYVYGGEPAGVCAGGPAGEGPSA